MRVILDTNVILSAIFFGGVPGHILNAYRDGKITLVLSPEILEEYRETAARLAEKFDVEYEALLEWIAIHSEMEQSLQLPAPVCVDPDDDKFIACALASNAKIICSGDRHLQRHSALAHYTVNVWGYFRNSDVLKPELTGL